MLLAFAPASINIRPASSAAMAMGSSVGVGLSSSGIELSIASIFEKIRPRIYHQN